MASPEQQAILALRQELDQTKNQLATMAGQYDTLKGLHDTLERNTDQIFRMQMTQINSAENRMSNLIKKQKVDLLDLKTLQPTTFSGKSGEAWKPWAKNFKLYCNGKSHGFRTALNWAEQQKDPITDLTPLSQWDLYDVADGKLYEFLLGLLDGAALQIAEAPGFTEA